MIKVLITGGSGDIAQSIKDELLNVGGFAIYSPSKEELDVTDLDSVNKFFEGKSFDIVINNAGYIKPASIKDSSTDNIYKTIMINLVGAFTITNKALKINPNAFIINIGSSAAKKVHADWSAYCSSKAGIIMATKCWYAEGFRTISLSPGRTKTKMRSELFSNEDEKSLLDPKDFAKIVLKAINFEYELGINIEVNKNTIGGLL